jgi:uncharacterized membrane protein YgdD (TMEM256/DUF423 family)
MRFGTTARPGGYTARVIWTHLLAAAAVNALVATAAGAFGAHALESRLDERRLAIWETAARYHMYGALAMALCAVAAKLGVDGAARAGWVMQVGVALFAATLYALALSGVKVLGAITPLGGALMMIAWAMLAIAAWRSRG